MIRLVIADHRALVREGLRALVSGHGCSVVGEAVDAFEALKSAVRVRPDILLLNSSIRGLDGFDVTRRLSARVPQARVILLCGHASATNAALAIRAGAAGCITTQSGSATLLDAITSVDAGERYFPAPFTEGWYARYAQTPAGRALERQDALTRREREVLRLTATGKPASEIGALLSISPRTVEAHRAHIMRKLDLHNHADMIRFAFCQGLADPWAASLAELPQPIVD